MSDKNLWEVYWYAALYGASATKRMEAVDNLRRWKDD